MHTESKSLSAVLFFIENVVYAKKRLPCCLSVSLNNKNNCLWKGKMLFDVYSARAIVRFFSWTALLGAIEGRLTIENHAATICLQSRATRRHIVTTGFLCAFARYVLSCQWCFVSKFAKTRRFAAICNRICAKFAIFRQKYKTSDKTVTKSTCNVVI